MVNDSTNEDFATALCSWVDSLTLQGKSGRRAVFVERSLKRKFKHTITSATKIRPNQIPMNWQHSLQEWRFLTLWHITNNIARKFKVEIPEEFKFRKLMSSI